MLCVCTYNQTRSVMMGALLDRRLHALAGPAVGFRVLTAGTAGGGHPATDPARRLLAEHGLDVSHHRSRALDATLVGESDLIVTAERDHVIAVAGQWPDAFAKTFTLPELVARAEATGPAAGRPFRAWLGSLHGDRSALDVLDDDRVPEVADPTGRSPRVWRDSFEQLDDLTRRLAALLVTVTTEEDR